MVGGSGKVMMSGALHSGSFDFFSCGTLKCVAKAMPTPLACPPVAGFRMWDDELVGFATILFLQPVALAVLVLAVHESATCNEVRVGNAAHMAVWPAWSHVAIVATEHCAHHPLPGHVYHC